MRNSHSQDFEMTKCSPGIFSDLSPIVGSHGWTRIPGRFGLYGFDRTDFPLVTCLGPGQAVVSHGLMRTAEKIRAYDPEMMKCLPVICLDLSLAEASHC